jgi:hypothetical protein
LHRHRRHAGEEHGVTVGRTHPDHVPDREHLGVAWKREIGLDRHPSGTVDLGARKVAKP